MEEYKQKALDIVKGYFGVSEMESLLPWPYERFDKIVEHEIPMTVADVLKGYKTRGQYEIDKRVVDSGSTGLTINHMLMLMAAKTLATEPELYDEIFTR